MPNTVLENQLVEECVGLLKARYGAWFSMNPSTTKFLKDVEEGGDKIGPWIKFMDSATFTKTVMQTNHTSKANCTTCAFCAPSPNNKYQKEMYINRSYVQPGTIVHETLHFLTHPAFSMFVNDVVQEAVTEYFTRKTLSSSTDQKFDVAQRKNRYDLEHTFLGFGREQAKSAEDHQKDYMKKAYFQGDFAAISLINRSLADLASLAS